MQKYKYCTKLHRYVQIVYPLKTAQIKNAQIYILHKTAKIHHRYENLQCTLTRCTKTAKIGNRKKCTKPHQLKAIITKILQRNTCSKLLKKEAESSQTQYYSYCTFLHKCTSKTMHKMRKGTFRKYARN